jgi:regulatory protein
VKISKIEPQKKSKRRSSIYIDGEFRFGLTRDLVTKLNLEEGKEITEEEIKDIVFQAEKEKIRQRAFRILNYRERSAKELTNRLVRLGFDQALVSQVIEDFIDDQTLDDHRFARTFISDYTKLKPRGNRFIIRELERHGVSREVIDKILKERDEGVLIRGLIERKFSDLDMSDPKAKNKIFRRLMNRGFTAEEIYNAFDKYEKF